MAEIYAKLIAYLLLCFAVCPSVVCEYEGQCPDGWTYFRASCYMFVDNMTMDWTEAGHHCALHQAHLVKIDNKAEDLFLQDMAKRLFRDTCASRTTSESFHTGASDAVIEGVWTWYTDHTDLVYTNWAPGQPETGNSRDQDCLFLAARDNYTWHDAECYLQVHPLCEIELTEDGSIGIIG